MTAATNGKGVYYNDYIKPFELLELAQPVTGHPEEYSFIRTHQVFELWFSIIIDELIKVKQKLSEIPNDANSNIALYSFNRANTILRLLPANFEIIETMDPGKFLEFRDFLSPASGFQSVQFRELEILLGLKQTDRVKIEETDIYNYGHFKAEDEKSLKEKEGNTSLPDVLYSWLCKIDIPEDFVQKILKLSTTGKIKNLEFVLEKGKEHRIPVLFLMIYGSDVKWYFYYNILKACMETENLLIIWRKRHASMVAKMIGIRTGLAGTDGVNYLEQTAQKYHVLADLEKVRGIAFKKNILDSV